MPATEALMLAGLMLLGAMFYASVGHAGASAYIAAMALFGLAPAVMKPTALTLNILVASLATYRLHRAGLIHPRALGPLVLGSIPLAFIGGGIPLPAHWYRGLVGVILLIAAARLFFQPRDEKHGERHAPASVPFLPGLLTGCAIGLLSGLTGTGGGIFLSPLLLFFGWAGARQASGIAAPFILVNSLAGLAGNYLSLRMLPAELPWFLIAVLIGALIGTQLGIRVLSPVLIQRVLALVLVVAGLKFLLT